MAKEIGLKLKITSQGQEKVISNLNDLENELQALQNQLKKEDFGSAKFQEVARNIQILKSRIEDVDKATEGVGIEKRLAGIGAAAGVLTGSFSILTGVIGTFIDNEEDLIAVQEAETKALAALNIVLGVREVSEGLLEGKIVARQLAEKAATLATRAATAVQAAFNAVLAANPIGFVVGALAALTAGVYLFVRATEEASTESEKENEILETQASLNRDLAETIGNTSLELKQQLSILTDNVSQRNLEAQVIDELKKKYPGFNEFIDENNKLTKEGIKFIKTRIELDQRQAVVQELIKRRADAQINAEKALREVVDENSTLFGKAQQTISQFFRGNIGDLNVFTGAVQSALKPFTTEIEAINRELGQQNTEIDNLLGTINPLQKKLDDAAEAEKKLGDATKQTFPALELQNTILAQTNKALANYISSLKLAQSASLDLSNETIEAGDKAVQAQKDNINKRNDNLKTAAESLKQELRSFFPEAVPGEEELVAYQDGFSKLFKIINDGIEGGDIDITRPIPWQDIIDYGVSKAPELEDAFKAIPEESQEVFSEFFNEIGDRLKIIQKGAAQFGKDIKLDNTTINSFSQLEDAIFNLEQNRKAFGLTEERFRQTALDVVRETFGFDKVREDLLNKLNLLEGDIQKASKEGNEDKVRVLKEQSNLITEQIKGVDNLSTEILDGALRSGEFYEGMVKIGEQIDTNYEKIIENRKEASRAFTAEEVENLQTYFRENAGNFDTLLEDLFSNFNQYIDKLGVDGVKGLLTSLQDGFGDLSQFSRKELEKIQSYLVIVGNEFSTLFNEDENPFLKLLEKISAKLKELPTESQEAFNESLANIKEVVDKVSQVLQDIFNRTSTILQAQTSLALEKLEQQTQEQLALVGEANTESVAENKKIEAEREKIQKQSAKTRFDIEKEGRVQELQFALANALAQSASAVINALALPLPPPAPQIYAGVLAGLTAAQVSIIGQQIEFTKSKTFIGRRGGLITGESHEGSNGGVPALLEGGEFVVNREAVKRFSNELQMINDSTGGRAVKIDDSRLVQAIASQSMSNKAPLKAYVVYNEIQDTDKLNKKIQQLSTL